MDWWKVSVLPFSVVVDEAWNGQCSRYEVCLYPLPYTLYMGRGNACSWRTVIKQRTDVGFVETDEGRSRRVIGWGEDRIHFREAMTGDIGESMIVRFEGKSILSHSSSMKQFKHLLSIQKIVVILKVSYLICFMSYNLPFSSKIICWFSYHFSFLY